VPLIEHFTLHKRELAILPGKRGPRMPENKLGFAVLLKYFQYSGCFPANPGSVPKLVLLFIANQVNCNTDNLTNDTWKDRSIKRYRADIRSFLGVSEWSDSRAPEFTKWLYKNLDPNKSQINQVVDTAIFRLKHLKIELPSRLTLERIARSSIRQWEDHFFTTISQKMPINCKNEIDNLLIVSSLNQELDIEKTSRFHKLKEDPGNARLNSILATADRLKQIEKVGIESDWFNN